MNILLGTLSHILSPGGREGGGQICVYPYYKVAAVPNAFGISLRT